MSSEQVPRPSTPSAAVGRPVPVASAETRPFWDAAHTGELRLPRCTTCDRLFYPPPPRCPECLKGGLEWVSLSRRGRLVSWTTVHVATVPGVVPPFTLAEVELEEQAGLVVAGLLVPPTEKAVIGCPVETTFTSPGPAGIAYPQFRVAGPSLDCRRQAAP